VLANRPWNQKKILYQLFAPKTTRQANQTVQEAARRGFTVGKSAKYLVDTSKYLPMCKAIGEYRGEWNEPFIARRSTRLAELAWDTVHPWLEA
jgi:hypothetical protein